jgi:hypothetical protein
MKKCIHGRTDKQKCLRCDLDLGDTFIDFNHMAPDNQWDRIITMLQENGYTIKKVSKWTF